MAKETGNKKKSRETVDWESRTLSVQDCKNVANLFLGGCYTPEYIYMMNQGKRPMTPKVATAIEAYCEDSIEIKEEYNLAIQEAVNRLDERMTDAGRSFMAEQLDAGSDHTFEPQMAEAI